MKKQNFEERYGKKVDDGFFQQAERIFEAISPILDDGQETVYRGLRSIGSNQDAMDLVMLLVEKVEFNKQGFDALAQGQKVISDFSKSTRENFERLEKEFMSLAERANKDVDRWRALLTLLLKAGMEVEATEALGGEVVILHKCREGLELNEDERDLIASELEDIWNLYL